MQDNRAFHVETPGIFLLVGGVAISIGVGNIFGVGWGCIAFGTSMILFWILDRLVR